MSQRATTRPPHGDAAAGQEETQQQPTETLVSEEGHARTRSPIKNGHEDNGTGNRDKDGSSNTLYKLLNEASDDADAMSKLNPDWNNLKGMVNLPCLEDESKTPLHLAAQKGFRTVVKKLLDEGAADASVGDEDGWTPLHFACSEGHTDVIDELLSHGADPKLTDNSGKNPLHLASRDGQEEAFNIIFKECPELLGKTTKAGMTPLHFAILYSNEQLVTACLKNSAAIDVKDNDGWTPLMTAVACKDKGSMDKLIQLVKEGVESELSTHLDTPDNDGTTPLMVACKLGWSQAVEDLDSAGANYNLRDSLGRTALHYAVRSRELPIIEIVIKKTHSEFLLKTDLAGESAFEGFDFDQTTNQQSQLDSITRLFFENAFHGYTQRGKLEWAAKGSKRSKIFRKLIEPLTSNHIFDGVDAENSSVFDLAVLSRLPWILWILIDNFPATSEPLEPVQKAQELAERLLLRQKGSKKPAQAEPRADQDKLKPDREYPILFDMQNYLKDFIVAETYRRNLFKPIKPPEGLEEVLTKFQATITQFLEGGIESSQGETKWIKQWRPVRDVIYTKGPGRIAKETMDRWLPDPLIKDDAKITTPLKWIHLPVTNIIWMEDLTKKILKERQLSLRETNSITSFLRSSWVQVPDRTSDSRSMRPVYVAKQIDETDMLEKVDPSLTLDADGVDPRLTPGDGIVADSKAKIKRIQGQDELSLSTVSAAYIPYLSFSRYTVGSIPDEKKEEREIVYEKLLQVHKDDAVHQSATLDESYYHFGPDKESRDDQDDRNKTQVVTRYLKDEMGESDQAFTLIKVKQLWVWTILDAVREQITEASSQPKFTARIATLIADYCVDAYERKRTSKEPNSDSSTANSHGGSEKRTRSIRQIFSDTVNDIARKEKRLFDASHKLTGSLQLRLVPESQNQQRQLETGSQKKKNADELEKVLKGASDLACDIKDLRDELNILRSIVNSQENVQREMAGNPETSVGITGLYFRKDIEEMENVAKRTQESVDTILNLAETEIANDQARQATKQGRTMMVFTVITIVFLPLSFLSSLFALSDVPFAQTPGWVHVVIFLVSFAIAVPVASFAIFSDAVAKQWNKIWNLIEKRLLNRWYGFLYRLVLLRLLDERLDQQRELSEERTVRRDVSPV
ncbi:ankyrin repeat [Fusarium sp. NRRL 25303]|nr:ankyrin repeat [Fusarium sp. NRRL 25303]